MATTVFLNGRFLEQKLTGVQRFAREITASIAELNARGEFPRTEVLIPRPRPEAWDLGSISCFGLKVRPVGRTHGHLWEQTELPRAARGGILLNLGNTGAILAGHRQVVVIHDAGVFDVPESYTWRFRQWYRALQAGLVRAHARIVTVSRFSRERIAARLAIDPADIAVTYEGAEHILRPASDPGALARYRLHPGRFVLAVGAAAGHKNLGALHRLAAELDRMGMVLVVVGARDYAACAAGPDGSGPACRMLGRVTDTELRSLYEEAACLVFPSRYEGFGLPPLEAMACGCPVIAAGGGAVEEVCGSAAIYFDPADPDAISELCRCLLDHPALACDLSIRSSERSARFTWERAASVLAGVIAEIDAADGRDLPFRRARDDAAFLSETG